jgi:hypothetical protein
MAPYKLNPAKYYSYSYGGIAHPANLLACYSNSVGAPSLKKAVARQTEGCSVGVGEDRGAIAFVGCGSNLFNLNSFNELKKNQTKIKILKNSSFDSNFNSVQSLNTNLALLRHLPSSNLNGNIDYLPSSKARVLPTEQGDLLSANATATHNSSAGIIINKNINKGKISSILRAIRSIRLNRDEWKLIRYIILMEKKIRSNSLFANSPSFYSEGGVAAPKTHSDSFRFRLRSDIFSKLFKQKRNNKKRNLNLFKNKIFASAQKYRELEVNKYLKKAEFLNAIPLDLRTCTEEVQQQTNKIYSKNNIISKNLLLQNMKYNFIKSTLSSILKKKIRSISEILEDKPIKNYVLYSYLKNCIFSSTHLNAGRTKLSLNKYKGRKLGSFINYNKIIGYKFNTTATHPASCSSYIGNAGDSFVPNHLNVGGCDSTASMYSLYRGFGVRAKAPMFKIKETNRSNINIKDTYKLLFYFFKSMYCLISKPVIKYSNDKITIQLFYYLNIPNKKIFRLFSIFYINSIKKKWLALMDKKTNQSKFNYPPSSLLPQPTVKPQSNIKIYIRWKLRKAISKFKNKNIQGKNLFFKLRKFNLNEVYQNKFKFICAILSKKFNKPVELQLIRLHHPYHDSNILVNLLSLNIKNKRKKARVAIQKIYNKKPVKNLNDSNLNSGKNIPAFLSGLNIKIAGRLMGEPIIPRITTKNFVKGANATGKVNYLDIARITKKNRKGAYTIKITSGQNFF